MCILMEKGWIEGACYSFCILATSRFNLTISFGNFKICSLSRAAECMGLRMKRTIIALFPSPPRMSHDIVMVANKTVICQRNPCIEMEKVFHVYM